MTEISIISKILEPNKVDCNKLQLFKTTIKFRKTMDDTFGDRMNELKKLVFQQALTAPQIVKNIIEENSVYTDVSSAIYMTARQLQSVKDKKYDIAFQEMVEMNIKRTDLQGSKYSYNIQDILQINEAAHQTTLIQNKTTAFKPFFDYFIKSFANGHIKEITGTETTSTADNNPEVVMLKKKVADLEENHARRVEGYEREIQRLREDVRLAWEKIAVLEKQTKK
ncbi:Hypothetical_protein [Hexamita inflata]|uniref:Hypothetical_protein n=1 Tax=Hexamita inflata TaxID=28002 RepID=A0AA86NM89_9EUKA|nr:Hypothetical protein HINF_LOCUS9141 [Hexamita inflata]